MSRERDARARSSALLSRWLSTPAPQPSTPAPPAVSAQIAPPAVSAQIAPPTPVSAPPTPVSAQIALPTPVSAPPTPVERPASPAEAPLVPEKLLSDIEAVLGAAFSAPAAAVLLAPLREALSPGAAPLPPEELAPLFEGLEDALEAARLARAVA
jgi:hypothetical protein